MLSRRFFIVMGKFLLSAADRDAVARDFGSFRGARSSQGKVLNKRFKGRFLKKSVFTSRWKLVSVKMFINIQVKKSA